MTRSLPATRAPEHLTRRMCEMAGIRPDMRVLEPSAGSGGMVKVIYEFTRRVISIELNADLHRELQAHDCERTYRRNFLDIKPWKPDGAGRNVPAELPMFDAVIMCPPARSDDHIQHAQRFLRHGGTVVALVQEQNVDLSLWPSYERVEDKFEMGGQDLPCGIIQAGPVHWWK